MTTPSINEIHAANESRFNAAHFSEALTAFTVGWQDPENLATLLDFVAPSVNVGRRFEFKRADNAEAFFSETDDLRAIGSTFKRVDYRGESVQAKTLNKGLTVRVDHDEITTSDWEERTVQILLQRLLRNELRRAITALDTAATNGNKVWDDSTNPDGDLRTMLIAAADESGIRPNRLILGEGAWDLRASAYESQNNAGANTGANYTLSDLARKLFLDDARVFSSRYQSSAATKSAIVGNAVYAFFGQQALSKDEPSNLKRFVTPSEGGDFRVFREEHTKFTDITVEHYSTVVATSNLGIRKLTVSAS
ncbi:hypothetical protein [Cerasicoccus arenae]|uniref:Uncharacterized protein n=1 Tax=Cerasicoccus arenae TaxID=424488 RepID=A0A8J3DIL1_9BACT|nr:hypothetical protein [Cerasicoccus arenae]MBK1858088.1 hypothetical protein [Cerasicoccus arenae]GHC07011.1 hypothetical protein GCM10007047_25110 [Cerasicoccus arenae]